MTTLLSATIVLFLPFSCHQIGGTTPMVITHCAVPNGQSMTLNCTRQQKVYIVNVTLGRGVCIDTNCCLENSVCVTEAYVDHFQYVKKMCHGKHMCTIFMTTGWCSGPSGKGTTDYESVHYVCSSTDPATFIVTTRPTTSMETSTTTKVVTPHGSTQNSITGKTASKPSDRTTQDGELSSTATVSNTADVNRSTRIEKHSTNSKANTALIVGLVATACVVVITAVLVVIICRRRMRHASHHQDVDSKSVLPARNINDTSTDCKYDFTQNNHHSNGKTVVPPSDVTPIVSLDELYTKPNKKVDNYAQDSQNASDYACVYGHVTAEPTDDGTTGSGNEELNYIQIDHKGVERATRNVTAPSESDAVTYVAIKTKTTSADTTPHDGDTDMSMVENDLYS